MDTVTCSFISKKPIFIITQVVLRSKNISLKGFKNFALINTFAGTSHKRPLRLRPYLVMALNPLWKQICLFFFKKAAIQAAGPQKNHYPPIGWGTVGTLGLRFIAFSFGESRWHNFVRGTQKIISGSDLQQVSLKRACRGFRHTFSRLYTVEKYLAFTNNFSIEP